VTTTLAVRLVALQVEDCLQDAAYEVEPTVRVCAVPGAAVVPVLIAAPEALAKVVAVLVQIDIVTVITVGRVLIGVGIAVIGAPPVLPVRLARAHTFLVPKVHGLSEHIGPVLIRLVISTTAIVAIAIRRIGETLGVPETQLVLTQSLQILLLKSELRHPPLLLKLLLPL
jgi:hypothetical protein